MTDRRQVQFPLGTLSGYKDKYSAYQAKLNIPEISKALEMREVYLAIHQENNHQSPKEESCDRSFENFGLLGQLIEGKRGEFAL